MYKYFSKICSFSFIIFLIVVISLFSGCGVRKRDLLTKLSPGMTKKEVQNKIGKPDEISCLITKDNKVIDIWKYNLATVDQKVANKRFILQLCGWLLFWPLLLYPATWEYPYNFDNYSLKFINNCLHIWSKSSDLRVLKLNNYDV